MQVQHVGLCRSSEAFAAKNLKDEPYDRSCWLDLERGPVGLLCADFMMKTLRGVLMCRNFRMTRLDGLVVDTTPAQLDTS